MGNLIGIDGMTQEQEFEELNRAYRKADQMRYESVERTQFPYEMTLYTVDFGESFIVAKRVDYGAGAVTMFEVSGGNGAKPMVTANEEQAYRWADYRNNFSEREMYRVMENNDDW